jgi:homoserine dehydrogenase
MGSRIPTRHDGGNAGAALAPPRQPPESNRSAPTAAVRVALLGFGTVGQAVARRLVDPFQSELRLACVCTRTLARTEVSWLPASVRRTSCLEHALSADIDVVVELIGGIETAGGLIVRALEGGRSVVTANKQLLAGRGGALLDLAARAKRQLRFEAAVGGGVPVIRAIQEGLAGDHLHRVIGVLNGTCTHVLSRMEDAQLDYAGALAEAQALGLAEFDPAADVDGLDARAKLAILAAIALGRGVSPAAIRADTIAAVSPFDFQAARRLDCSIRQLAWAERNGPDGSLAAGVGPALITRSSPLAQARGAQNAVLVTGRNGGSTLIAGTGAGGDATAVAVMSDLLSIARSPAASNGSWAPPLRHAATSDKPVRHYVRAATRGTTSVRAVLAAAGLGPRNIPHAGPGRGSHEHEAWIVDACTRKRLDAVIAAATLDPPTRDALLLLPYFTQADLDRPPSHVHPGPRPPAHHPIPDGAVHV